MGGEILWFILEKTRKNPTQKNQNKSPKIDITSPSKIPEDIMSMKY